MNEGKQRAGLYIFPSLHVKIGLVAHRQRWSWNQAATVLLERGLEAQPGEVADLVTGDESKVIDWRDVAIMEDALRNALLNGGKGACSVGIIDPCLCWRCKARTALAPFDEGVDGE